MRKAHGVILVPLLAALFSSIAWADNARDGAVNPGNAMHIGAVEQPAVVNAEAAAEDEAIVDGPTAKESSCGGCGCEVCGCSRGCGTLEFFGPVALVNQHPLTTLFLSPVPDRATVLQPDAGYFKLKLDWSNQMIREVAAGTFVDFDFELLRVTPEYHRGMFGGELSARLPLAYRSHGVLDGIIADWHGIFGLKNGWRTDFPDQMYRYAISTRDGLVYNEEGDTLGIGDLAIEYKYALWDSGAGGDAAALRAGFKAPTGDPGKALGSGNWDYLFGGLYERQISQRLRGYANLDYVFVGEPDWENIAYQDMLVGLAALEYAYKPGTTYLAQYRYQRNPLRTGNNEADKDSQELALAFHHRLSDRLVWTGGFNEDINPETAPDLVFMTNLKWEF